MRVLIILHETPSYYTGMGRPFVAYATHLAQQGARVEFVFEESADLKLDFGPFESARQLIDFQAVGGRTMPAILRVLLNPLYALFCRPLKVALTMYDTPHLSRRLLGRLNSLASRGGYDVVLVAGPIAPVHRLFNSPAIVVAFDSFALAWGTVSPYASAAQRIKDRVDCLRLTHRERRYYSKASLALTVSEEDARALERTVPGLKARVVKNGAVVTGSQRAKKEAYALFVGELAARHNQDALRFFLGHVWPRVRSRISEARFVIIGRHTPAWLQEHHGLHGVEVLGEVEFIEPYFSQAAVNVVPMVSSTGVKNKILDALAEGTAVVTTTLGLRGLEPALEGLDVADHAEEFAEAVARHIREPAWIPQGLNDVKLSWGRGFKQLDAAISEALNS